MAFDISNLPAGLASLLNLQQRGRGPQFLAETVSPVIDLLQLYAANQFQSLEASSAAVAGGMNHFTVPGGELWLVHSISARLGAAVPGGGSLRVAPAYALKANVVLCPLALTEAFVAGQTAQWGARGPLLVTSGGIVGSYVAQVTGAMTVTATVTMARLRI